MKFLDLNGLNHLWTKIKASFGTAIVFSSKCEINGSSIIIPFVTNHQCIKVDTETDNNVYNWFQKASRGGILEIVFAGAQGGNTYCYNNGDSYMYKMQVLSHGPLLNKITYLATAYDTYARLIKTDDNKLVVAEFVQNK